jgi:exodeoxyribonuclease-5
MELTPEQKTVHDAAVVFALKGDDAHLTIGGLAGTGKTTLTGEIVRALRKAKPGIHVAFCCYTGKAASVLRSKLVASQTLDAEEYCGTIHGLIYEPVVKHQVIIGWRRVPDIPADLIIVDEASMVNEPIWNDLRSYGRPTIAIGDHGQLPPIEGAFNLMNEPHHRLVKVHRQAEGNPIIRLSMLARESGEIPFGVHGDGIVKMAGSNEDVLNRVKEIRDVLFLCGLNRTRQSVNRAVRARLGFKGDSPCRGEKVICLRNNRELQIYNGVSGTLKKFDPYDDTFAQAEVDMETGTTFTGWMIRPQFGAERTLQELKGVKPKELRELFDWGYCITVHKAQGSEADNVVLFEERFSRMDDDQWRRWLYTAVTRAKKKLLIVSRRFDRSQSQTAGASQAETVAQGESR